MRDALQEFERGLLGYHPCMLRIVPAADADPDCALKQAYAATLHMLGESRAAPDGARPYIARAYPTDAHGRMVVAATRAWIDNDVPTALAIGDAIVAEYPRDLCAAKIVQYHRFNRGDAAGLLRTGLSAAMANPANAHAHAMAAFGHEQTSDMRAAERAARTAIDLDPDEPWAHHALAHVLLTEGRNDEALAFLTAAAPSWTGLLSFMRTHNHWHLALVRIERGETGAVLHDFDRHVWNAEPSLPQDQVGAVSLLARLELVGVDVGGRWGELAPWLLRRIDDHVQPFLSLQYVYGLARAGERAAARDMLAAIRATAAAEPWAAWAEVCVPASEGLLAHAEGDMALAADRLGAVLPTMERIGGSHAQRDLFEQIYTDALIGAGRPSEAVARLRARLVGNPDSLPSRIRLSRLH